MNQFQWNPEMHEWQRTDRVQEYRGIKIETITTHDDTDRPRFHREYRLTFPTGKESYFRINKRGGNIKDLKFYIDIKLKEEESK